eukprot:CAMPEP_0184696910 /NCGR_PEP_ID=MMETSP0313-20130426/4060_1 /TAXON_ID=2792 /ORGANISM="Porphyridium aerugineum, Strain SAG 1380-2" /LENGTH=391 /DNA_ID=CAMNT_0027155637 /DNA_START=154 /DNA_END=1326 /DNA_ORIENTATION=+
MESESFGDNAVERRELFMAIAASRNRYDLETAASFGDYGTVWQRLEEGAPVDNPEQGVNTALMLAAFGGFVDIVRLLFSRGASINRKNASGENALWRAASAGYHEVVQVLLDSGAAPNEPDNDYKRTALSEAVVQANDKVVKVLLAYSVPFSAQDFRCALEGQNENLAISLLEANPPVALSVVDPMKRTPLIMACRNRIGMEHLVKLLIEKGQDVHAIDPMGWSAVYYACQTGNLKVIKVLVANGANLIERDSRGVTPLILATQHVRIVKYIISKVKGNLDYIESSGSFGTTALHAAVAAEKQRVVQILLRAGCRVDCWNNNTTQPIGIATGNRNLQIMSILFDAGANPYTKDFRNTNLFAIVAQNRYYPGGKFRDAVGAILRTESRCEPW